jgi:hypothetical protein
MTHARGTAWSSQAARSSTGVGLSTYPKWVIYFYPKWTIPSRRECALIPPWRGKGERGLGAPPFSAKGKGPEPPEVEGTGRMREAGASSTEEVAKYFPGCERPTGGSHGRTAQGRAQRFKRQNEARATKGKRKKRGQGHYEGWSPKAPALQRIAMTLTHMHATDTPLAVRIT